MNARRRDFLKTPLAAAVATALPAAVREGEPDSMKLCRRVSSRISENDLLFLQQIGLRWARVNFPLDRSSYDDMATTKRRFERYGLRIHSAVNYNYRSLDVQLGRPGRDRYLDRYNQFLRDCGKLGFPVASYDFHPANTYTTQRIKSKRGYETREFRLADFRNRVEEQKFEREYPVEEIWGYYEEFMEATLPVAAESGVVMALHPDDPPLAKMNGVGKMFVHFDGYHRAEQIAERIEGHGAPHWGLTFCVGTWSEGGDRMGKDVFEMIDHFGSRGKIAEVHFRAVSSPLPDFHETLPDEGYLDLYEVMKRLREVRFTGAIMPDHVPPLVDDRGIRYSGTAYTIAYMRGLLKAVNTEF